MKKILYITTIAGFLPKFEMNDVKIMQSLGYEVHYASNFNVVVYNFDQADLLKQGVILHHIDIVKSPTGIRNHHKAIRQLKEIIDRENISIVHCHNPMGGLDGRLAARLSRKKPYVMYTAHGFHFYEGAPLMNWILYYPAEKFCSHMTDKIITINDEDFKRAMAFPTRKRKSAVRIHGVGVNKDIFKPNRAIADEKREELNVPQDAFHIVTAAELNDNKNQKVIIEAIHNIQNKNIYYSMCGKGPSESYLRELIEKYELSDRVRLLGYRNDMEEILQTADCFAFPSKREGLGVAAIEALLCGVPVIAAENRGTREYVINFENGIMCKTDCVGDYEQAILKLLNDKTLKQQMSEAARESAKKFCIEEVSKVMFRVYNEVTMEVDRRENN